MKTLFGEICYEHEDVTEQCEWEGWDAISTRLEEALVDFTPPDDEPKSNYRMVISYTFEKDI